MSNSSHSIPQVSRLTFVIITHLDMGPSHPSIWVSEALCREDCLDMHPGSTTTGIESTEILFIPLLHFND